MAVRLRLPSLVLGFALFAVTIACPLQDGSAGSFCCLFSESSGDDHCGTCKKRASTRCGDTPTHCANCEGTWCGSAPGQGSAQATPPTAVPVPGGDAPADAAPSDAAEPVAAPEPETPSEPAAPAEPAAAEGEEPEPAQGTMGASDASGNPFKGRELYVNPTLVTNLQKSMKTASAGAEMSNLQTMSKTASAYWLDVKGKVQPGDDGNTTTAAGILKDAASKPVVPLVTLIVYNLPNRDCAAKASNGQICCGGKKPEGNCDYLDASATGKCEKGLTEYKEEYIDQLAIVIKDYCDKVPMALVIEPDSLPNLVTNLDEPKCGSSATKAAYTEGIAYASNTLKVACPAATQYLDGAHGGWLGWPDNLKGFTEKVKELDISKNLRGFSLNVANYQPLGTLCPEVGYCVAGKNAGHACCQDPCKLGAEYNQGHSELNYAAALRKSMQEGIPGFDCRMIIDTGRNAQNPRAKCSNWCNIRGAGAGLRPTTDTAMPDVVDAYHWLKTPGESDGCTEELPGGGKCPRYDSMCGSADSIGSQPGEPRCPEAGGWFDFQVRMLAKNAKM